MPNRRPIVPHLPPQRPPHLGTCCLLFKSVNTQLAGSKRKLLYVQNGSRGGPCCPCERRVRARPPPSRPPPSLPTPHLRAKLE